MERKVNCPSCGKPTLYSPENKFRPFCSERCRTIDLGAWADESYRVPIADHTPGARQDLDSDEETD